MRAECGDTRNTFAKTHALTATCISLVQDRVDMSKNKWQELAYKKQKKKDLKEM